MTSRSDRTLRERIERAMETLALIMEDDGEVYAPIFERLEQELAALDRRDSAVDRARRLARRRQLLAQTLNPAGAL
jgi:hypothetical protein